ncbi:T9SS type A sorting domain-containing protein [bacterium]|nr:T9SS type A sorting domain-containing protein [bacterium]
MFYKIGCNVLVMNLSIKLLSKTVSVLCFILVYFSTTAIAQNSQNCTLIGCAGIGRSSGVGVAGNIACFGDDLFYLRILDVTSPSNPNVLASIFVPSNVQDVVINGHYAFAAIGSSGLRIFDISNPVDPKEVGSLDTYGSARSVAIKDSFAFVASAGLHILNISDPVNVTEVGLFDTYGGVDVAVNGTHAYVAAGSYGLRVIDISNPASPVETDYVTTGYGAVSVAVSNPYVYVLDSRKGLGILDISNPADLKAIGLLDKWDTAADLAVSGTYAYVLDVLNGLWIIDISDPANPAEVGFYKIGIYTPENVVVNDSYIYIVDYSFGLYIVQNDLLTGVEEHSNPTEEHYTLYQNYPNPFNSSTKISFEIPQQSSVSVKIYDLLGQEVRTLVDEDLPEGVYNITLNAEDFPSGLYIYRLQADQYQEEKKLLILR